MPHSEKNPWVVILMQPFLRSNYTVHTNYCTSSDLAKCFWESGTHFCGTDKNFPIKKGQLNSFRNEVLYYINVMRSIWLLANMGHQRIKSLCNILYCSLSDILKVASVQSSYGAIALYFDTKFPK